MYIPASYRTGLGLDYATGKVVNQDHNPVHFVSPDFRGDIWFTVAPVSQFYCDFALWVGRELQCLKEVGDLSLTSDFKPDLGWV